MSNLKRGVAQVFGPSSPERSGRNFQECGVGISHLLHSFRSMNVCTDSPRFAEQWFPSPPHWRSGIPEDVPAGFRRMVGRLLPQSAIATASIEPPGRWQNMVIVERAHGSQFDTLVDAMRAGVSVPDGLICLAGSGEGFHGQRGRAWTALPGNIHLSLFFSPGQDLKEIGAGLTVLPAVSILQTLDCIPGLEMRAGIRWVNDILIEESKVAGFLVHTQSSAGLVTGAVIGIGLNVETVPHVAPTMFVPSVTAVHHHVSDPRICSVAMILHRLLSSVSRNYEMLLRGHASKLLALYRERSLIIGRRVVVYRDLENTPDDDENPVAGGTVLSIGDRLELILEGERRPVYGGRVVMKQTAAGSRAAHAPTLTAVP